MTGKTFAKVSGTGIGDRLCRPRENRRQGQGRIAARLVTRRLPFDRLRANGWNLFGVSQSISDILRQFVLENGGKDE
ncbi:MAG: hypothetical protein FWD67_12185 [Betaproteobacteria bacterium]|nr:hypothetical protein [Betaproteobacteria bacterium]